MEKTYVLVTEQYGRGVYAVKNIRKGSVIEMAETLLLNNDDTWRVNHTELKDYTFVVEEGDRYDKTLHIGVSDVHCLVLGNGELYNHSDKPNASYELINLNGRKMMVFTALEDINEDEQVFIDYNADTKYPVNIGVEQFTTNLI